MAAGVAIRSLVGVMAALWEVTNPGRWIHIAEHLESGMMSAFTVNRPRTLEE